jgi:K+-transporting ATPase ATPase B chain
MTGTERRQARERPLWDAAIVRQAAWGAVKRLNPRDQLRNPVMLVVLVGAVLTTGIWVSAVARNESAWFAFQIAVWLWFTLIFANFAEAFAEGRGKAQAESLRLAKTSAMANRIKPDGQTERLPATQLRKDDLVMVRAGDIIPADGTVEEGVASVDESAITGESAPVIRESGGDRSAVTGGTRVISDWIKVRVSVNPGESYLDRLIGLVEGARRRKTPNEVALTILITGLTALFLVAVVTLPAFAGYAGTNLDVVSLIALLVCLIPTTIGGLLSAIGIAGMDRMLARNVVAKSGRAVETAGDIDVILLDKTGTITQGNRQAVEFVPLEGGLIRDVAEAALVASIADDTPEGRSIVALAQEQGLERNAIPKGTPVPFSAQTRMSGVDLPGKIVRKGAPSAVQAHVVALGGKVPPEMQKKIDAISEKGATPLLVAVDKTIVGIIHLKDVLKPGIADRLRLLHRVGIRTVMITGDNPLTAKAIAKEAGIDDYIAEAKPEDKLAFIRKEQAKGLLVAMVGDGTNDAPALAQSDVGLAMNTGTQAAREAGNMVDLDSSPTKLIDVIEIGKQLLMTRGSLTTFSVANDVAKYFAIIPAMFPLLGLGGLNVMRLHSPESAILSAVIFNALIIIALVPLALKGVQFRPAGASAILRRNLLWFGLGGIIVPFVGIKAIDLLLVALHLG